MDDELLKRRTDYVYFLAPLHLQEGDSTRLITASADQTAKLRDVKNGREIYSFSFNSPARCVEFSIGEKLAVITTDPFMGLPSTIQVKQMARDPNEETGESVLQITGPSGRINRAIWGPLNKTIISAGEDATIRIWDSETGQLVKESDRERGHQKAVTSISKSADGSYFLTGSLDKSAKLWDTRSLTLIKTYVTESPVNACTMSPLLNHVAMGGGLDASIITQTSAGKFESKFFHKILEEEVGAVKGHFGPINALAFNPNGRVSHREVRMATSDCTTSMETTTITLSGCEDCSTSMETTTIT